MSAFKNFFSLSKAHRIFGYLRNNKINSYVFHPVTLMSIAAVGIPFATIYCSDQKPGISDEKFKEPFKLPGTKELSLKKLIQHSSYVTVNAVMQMVQLTTAAVLDASEKYREAVSAEILVLNQSLEYANMEHMQGQLNDLLIIIRADTKQAEVDLREYIGFMEYVEKLANAAAETSFLSGAEYPSFSLSDIIYDSQKRISQQLEKNKSVAEELLELQKEVIIKTEKREEAKAKIKDSEEKLVSGDDSDERVLSEPVDNPTQEPVTEKSGWW